MSRWWMRGLIGAGLLAAAVVGAVAFQRLNADRQYHRLLASGDAALAAGQSYRAVEAFSGALAFRPDSMVAYLRRGEAYRDQGRHDDAVRDWREATRLAPDAPQPLVELGDLYEATGEFRQAADWYAQAAERLHDEDPSLLYRLALARYRSGAPGAAIDPLERAVVRNDASAAAHYLLGLLYRDTNNAERAITSLQTALTIEPDLAAAREELADLFRELKRPVEEMAQLQILARDGTPSRQVAIGLAEARGGQYDAALGTLNGALERTPNDSLILLAIGRVQLARAERSRDSTSIQRALDALERALGGTARRGEGLSLYGRALYLSGDVAGAERILRDAVATSPVDPAAFGYLADAAERAGHARIARDALANLDMLQGDTAPQSVRSERARRIGGLSIDIGDYKDALESLEQAADGMPGDALTMGLLAEARWHLGDTAVARELADKALAADPRNPRLQRIARLVRERSPL